MVTMDLGKILFAATAIALTPPTGLSSDAQVDLDPQGPQEILCTIMGRSSATACMHVYDLGSGYDLCVVVVQTPGETCVFTPTKTYGPDADAEAVDPVSPEL